MTHFHLAFSPLACTCFRASSFSETSRLRAKKSGVYLSTNNLKRASSTRKPQNVFALKRFWQQVLTNSLHNLQTEPDRIQVHASDGAALLRGSWRTRRALEALDSSAGRWFLQARWGLEEHCEECQRCFELAGTAARSTGSGDVDPAKKRADEINYFWYLLIQAPFCILYTGFRPLVPF